MHQLFKVFRCLVGFILCLPIIAFAASNIPSTVNTIPQLTAIQVTPLAEQQAQITLKLSAPLAEPPKYFVTQNPARVVVDLPNIQSGLTGQDAEQQFSNGLITHVSTVTVAGKTRLVVDLSEAANVSLETKQNQLTLRLTPKALPAQTTVNAPSVNPFTTKVTPMPEANLELNQRFSAATAAAAKQMHAISGVDFRAGKNGGGQVTVDVSDPNMVVDVQQQKGKIIVEFDHTMLPDRLLRSLNTSRFNTVVTDVAVQRKGDDAVIAINAKGNVRPEAYQIDKRFYIDIKPVVSQTAASSDSPIYQGEKLSLNFQDIKVRAVLQLIADFTGLNIVTSDSVTGSITLRLKDVPWDQALDIILKTKGLAKRRTGNIILIAPADEIARFEKQELEAKNQLQTLAPLDSAIIQINYAKAADVAALLKNKDSSLLSDRGRVSVDVRTNTLLVQDTPANLAAIRQLVAKLDIPIRQVLIEARIVNIDKTYERELGVRWGVTNKGADISGTLAGANQLAQGVSPANIPLEQRLNLDLPVNTIAGAVRSGSLPNGSFGVALAHLGAGFMLDLELSALESEGRAQVISSPRVLTANQQAAVIEAGEEIPYQQSTSSGATSVSFKKAVLSLTVTPQITPDDRIVLNLAVTQDKRSSKPAVLGVPAIDTRKVETQVLVNNGETIVLGGIYDETKNNTVVRIPFLSDIPWIGQLFRHNYELNQRTELLIFVTPKIVKRALV